MKRMGVDSSFFYLKEFDIVWGFDIVWRIWGFEGLIDWMQQLAAIQQIIHLKPGRFDYPEEFDIVWGNNVWRVWGFEGLIVWMQQLAALNHLSSWNPVSSIILKSLKSFEGFTVWKFEWSSWQLST